MADTNKILVKFLTGKKNDIQARIIDGTIDEGDFIATSDTNEFIFINANKEIRPLISRTKEEYISKINIGGIKKNDIVRAGIDLDSFIEQLLTGEENSNQQIQLIRDVSSPEPGYYQYGESLTLNVVALAAEAGTIDIYMEVNGTESHLVATGFGTTLSSTIVTPADATNIKIYATVDDIQSNQLVYEFKTPLIFWDTATVALTDAEIVNIIYSNTSQKYLKDIDKVDIVCEVSRQTKTVWFAISKEVGFSSIKGIYSEDGDNISSLFKVTEMDSYIICKYESKITFPSSTRIIMRIDTLR